MGLSLHIEEYLSNKHWRKRRECIKGYLAGFIDGEGCISSTKHKFIGNNNKRYCYYKPCIRIANTHKDTMIIIGKILDKLGVSWTWYEQNRNRWNSIYYISIRKKNSIILLLSEILPYLITKNEQARIMLELLKIGSHINNNTDKLAKELSYLNTKGKFWRKSEKWMTVIT